MDGVQELIDGWVSQQQHLDIAAATPHRGWSLVVVILAAMGSRHFDDSNVCVVVVAAAAGYWSCTTLRRLLSVWYGDCWSSLILWHGIWSLLAPIVIWNEAAAFVLFCYWLLMTLSLLGRCFNSILALWADAQFNCVFLGRWNFWHMTAPNGSSGTFWKSISCMSHLCHTI